MILLWYARNLLCCGRWWPAALMTLRHTPQAKSQTQTNFHKIMYTRTSMSSALSGIIDHNNFCTYHNKIILKNTHTHTHIHTRITHVFVCIFQSDLIVVWATLLMTLRFVRNACMYVCVCVFSKWFYGMRVICCVVVASWWHWGACNACMYVCVCVFSKWFYCGMCGICCGRWCPTLLMTLRGVCPWFYRNWFVFDLWLVVFVCVFLQNDVIVVWCPAATLLMTLRCVCSIMSLHLMTMVWVWIILLWNVPNLLCCGRWWPAATLLMTLRCVCYVVISWHWLVFVYFFKMISLWYVRNVLWSMMAGSDPADDIEVRV